MNKFVDLNYDETQNKNFRIILFVSLIALFVASILLWLLFFKDSTITITATEPNAQIYVIDEAGQLEQVGVGEAKISGGGGEVLISVAHEEKESRILSVFEKSRDKNITISLTDQTSSLNRLESLGGHYLQVAKSKASYLHEKLSQLYSTTFKNGKSTALLPAQNIDLVAWSSPTSGFYVNNSSALFEFSGKASNRVGLEGGLRPDRFSSLASNSKGELSFSANGKVFLYRDSALTEVFGGTGETFIYPFVIDLSEDSSVAFVENIDRFDPDLERGEGLNSDAPHQIHIVGLDGSEVHEKYSVELDTIEIIDSLVFSGSSNYVAVLGGSSVSLINRESNTTSRVARFPENVSAAAWSDEVLYVLVSNSLWAVDVDSGVAHKIYTDYSLKYNFRENIDISNGYIWLSGRHSNPYLPSKIVAVPLRGLSLSSE